MQETVAGAGEDGQYAIAPLTLFGQQERNCLIWYRHTGDIVQRVLLEHTLLQLREGCIGSKAVAIEDRTALYSWIGRRQARHGSAGLGHDAQEAHRVVILLEPYPIPEVVRIIDFW